MLTARFSVQHDHRVPPAERLKDHYRLLEQHYDITGGDYDGQSTLLVCGTTSNSRRTGGYPIVRTRYVESIGADLDSLDSSNDMSPDPMNDLTDEGFCHSIFLSPTPKGMTAPISTWGIDWSRPLPQTAHAYWEITHVS